MAKTHGHTERLNLRISKRQKRAFEAAALAEDRSLSSWVRHTLNIAVTLPPLPSIRGQRSLRRG